MKVRKRKSIVTACFTLLASAIGRIQLLFFRLGMTESFIVKIQNRFKWVKLKMPIEFMFETVSWIYVFEVQKRVSTRI